jgi:hypothetical protein
MTSDETAQSQSFTPEEVARILSPVTIAESQRASYIFGVVTSNVVRRVAARSSISRPL